MADPNALFGAKKKKKRRRKPQADTAETPTEATQESPVSEANGTESAQEDTYSYEELLTRAFQLLGETKQEKKGPRIPPPQAYRIGTSRTLWSNFPAILKALNRSPDHLLTFVTVELGTPANRDGNGRLVIKGRFMPKQLETLVRNYCAEYVTCKTCGSRDTILKKENRLQFIECQSPICGSTRSVPPLTRGYVQDIKRRK